VRSKVSFASAFLGVLVFLGIACPSAQAGLVYENINGASLIYDTSNGTTWTQNANISGQSFTQQGAEAWAASLNVVGLPSYRWSLPTPGEFTSLYSQLDPPGGPGPQLNKFGATVSFGTGPNDYASNVEPQYWTSVANTDFNFYYGFAGGPSLDPTFAWAVAVPEPSSIVLMIFGIGGAGALRLLRSGRDRLSVG
jgi:PEP-CTERM motif